MFVGHRGTTWYYHFGESGANDGAALVFSPDGSVIYIATDADTVFALDSAGGNSDPEIWSAAVGDSNLCDIAVSPDGLSVRLSRFSEVLHL